MLWILGPSDRCCGSLGRRIGGVDPWTGGWVLWILGPADRCCGSLYPMGWWIGVVDPRPADRCCGFCYPMG